MGIAGEAGEAIGKQLSSANRYKDDFIATQGTLDYNAVHLKNLKVFFGYKVTQKFITGCSPLPFVLDHPVHGNLNSGTYHLDAGYCSTSTHSDTTGDL